MGWMGSRVKKSWVRLRSSAAGRRRPFWYVNWTCSGCSRIKKYEDERTGLLDGRSLCRSCYNKHLKSEEKAAKK